MRTQLKRLLPMLAVLSVGLEQARAEPDAFLDLDVGLGLDDNVTRAQENIDIEHDVFVQAIGTLGTELWEGRSSALSGSAGLGVQQFNDYDGLSNISLRLRLDYVFGFSSDFHAPWYAIDGSYTLQEFDSSLRDSDIFSVGATMGFRIDDATAFRTGLNYKVRESDGKAFDTEDVSLFINFDFTFANSFLWQRDLTLYTTYKLQEGDVFSTASTATAFATGTPVALALASAAIPKDQPDDVFGGIAYRLDATTHIVTIGFNLKMNLQSAYDLSLRVLSSETDVGLEYEDLALSFSYFHKFGLEF